MDNQPAHTMTRRDFGKVSAAAGFSILASRSAAAKANSGTLKIGLLGCGNRCTKATEQMLMGNDNVQLVALADLFEDKLQKARERIANNEDERVRSKYAVDPDHCFVGLDAYKKILATDIDVVMEGTLPYSRSKHIAAAVDAGKHIFTEKPVAVDPAGVRMVIAAGQKAQQKGLSIVAGTQRRHQKEYVETIQKIHDGAIGEVVAARAYWCSQLPFAHDRKEGWSDFEYRIRNWINYCWVCGDNIVEQHVHNLDVVNWVMNGHPASVIACGGRAWKPVIEKYGDLFDHFSCDYEYANGVHMSSFSRHWYDCERIVKEEIVGTKGMSDCRSLGVPGTDPYVQEHIDLVASIRGAGPYLNEGVQVAESTMTAIMGRMAAYTGKRVTWDEALNADLSIVPDKWDFGLVYPLGPVPTPGAPKEEA